VRAARLRSRNLDPCPHPALRATFSRKREKGKSSTPPACGRRKNQQHLTYLNSSADITKLNISTSSEALTTARVVATEVPSMVGSAW
jgi:hypothetical protein